MALVWLATAGASEAAPVEQEPRTLPWRRLAASEPVWALAAAHAASNVFLYFSVAWLPSFFVDVFGDSTGSARAGVVDVASGKLLGVHKQDIKMWEPLPEHYEQSSDDIWDAVCACTRGALAAAGAGADDVVCVSVNDAFVMRAWEKSGAFGSFSSRWLVPDADPRGRTSPERRLSLLLSARRPSVSI